MCTLRNGLRRDQTHVLFVESIHLLSWASALPAIAADQAITPRHRRICRTTSSVGSMILCAAACGRRVGQQAQQQLCRRRSQTDDGVAHRGQRRLTAEAMFTSSKPTRAMSCGIRRPASRSAFSAPMAMTSLATKIAVGEAASNCFAPACRCSRCNRRRRSGFVTPSSCAAMARWYPLKRSAPCVMVSGPVMVAMCVAESDQVLNGHDASPPTLSTSTQLPAFVRVASHDHKRNVVLQQPQERPRRPRGPRRQRHRPGGCCR